MLSVERIGHGPPVLFVHGDIVGPSLTWRKQRELAERWRLLIPSRPGFGDSAPLDRNDFEVEAPMFAELLGDGAHLVGHSYGAVIALLAAAERPGAVRSLTVSEPGALRLAAGNPEVDAMIENGNTLYRDPESIPPEVFLRLFRSGVGSANETPDQLPDWLAQGVAERLGAERTVITGRGHTIPSTGEPYNRVLERHLAASELP
ncbi:MAG: alpha/beta fold hydrolase [Solirubrobacterales bacterium]